MALSRCDSFQEQEVRLTSKQIKVNKVSGPDFIQAEIIRTILE